jgi:magnesium transporter
MRILVVNQAGRSAEVLSLEEAAPGSYRLLWVDQEGAAGFDPGPLRESFGLHPLVFSSAGAGTPLPRLQEFDDYIYMVWHFLGESSPAGEPEPRPLYLVMGRDFLLTLHQGVLEELDLLQERLLAAPERFPHPAALLYQLLESAVDGCYPAVEALTESIDDYMDRLVSEGSGKAGKGSKGLGDGEDLSPILALKHRNMAFRRVLYAHRDMVLKLSRHEQELVPAEWVVYMVEVYDRLARLAAEVEYNGEQIATALDIHLNAVSNLLNRTMKRLTAVATFFMPATFLVGLYGMNFEAMPEYAWRYGYLFFWALLVVLTVAMVWLGRRQDWY